MPSSNLSSEAERRARALRASVKYADPARRLGGDPLLDDMEVFRCVLARRVATLAHYPCRCREPICRRSKLCAGPDMRCHRDIPLPPATREQQAAVMANVKRLIERELARRGATGT